MWRLSYLCRMDTLLAELEARGVAVLRDAIEPEVVTTARHALSAVASAEHDAGTALLEDGSAADGHYLTGVNQRVVGLLGKGEAFRRLAVAPAVLAVVRRVLGDDAVLLSSVTANVANVGGKAMALHADQGFVPPETPYAVLANAIWPLVDFTAANGATRSSPAPTATGERANRSPSRLPPARSSSSMDGRSTAPGPTLATNLVPLSS